MASGKAIGEFSLKMITATISPRTGGQPSQPGELGRYRDRIRSDLPDGYLHRRRQRRDSHLLLCVLPGQWRRHQRWRSGDLREFGETQVEHRDA